MVYSVQLQTRPSCGRLLPCPASAGPTVGAHCNVFPTCWCVGEWCVFGSVLGGFVSTGIAIVLQINFVNTGTAISLHNADTTTNLMQSPTVGTST